MKYEIKFSGHENIRSNHKNTLEITKDSQLTPRGDCIIGVNATSACSDLPADLKNKLRDHNTTVTLSIRVNNYEFVICGKGHPDLILSHSEDIVIRKSDFVCPRTLAIHCDKASDLLPCKLVKLLQNPNTTGVFTITTS